MAEGCHVIRVTEKDDFTKKTTVDKVAEAIRVCVKGQISVVVDINTMNRSNNTNTKKQTQTNTNNDICVLDIPGIIGFMGLIVFY